MKSIVEFSREIRFGQLFAGYAWRGIHKVKRWAYLSDKRSKE